MIDSAVIHLGGYKTGSTALQRSIARLRGPLLDRGVVIPAVGTMRGAHHGWAVQAEAPLFQHRLRAELAHSPGDRLFVSTEHLSRAEPQVAKCIIDALPTDVALLFVSRRPDEVLLSHWADRISAGWPVELDAYLRTRLAWPDIDLAELDRCWPRSVSRRVLPYGADAVQRILGTLGAGDLSDLGGVGERPRRSPGIATSLATADAVEHALLIAPDLASQRGRWVLARAIQAALGPSDDSPPASALGLPISWVEPVLAVALDPRELARRGWQVLPGEPWTPADLIARAGAPDAAAWLQEWQGPAARLLTDLDLPSLVAVARAGCSTPTMSIPTRVVQYWHEDDPPPDVRPLMDSWAALNPDVEYLRFGRSNRDWLVQATGVDGLAEALERSTHPAMEADLVRLAALWVLGGFYVDAEHEAVQPLSRLNLGSASLMLARTPRGHMTNWFLGAVAGHPLIGSALRLAVDRTLSGQRPGGVWWTTGPGVLNAVLEDWASRPDTVVCSTADCFTIARVHRNLEFQRDHWSGRHPMQRPSSAS